MWTSWFIDVCFSIMQSSNIVAFELVASEILRPNLDSWVAWKFNIKPLLSARNFIKKYWFGQIPTPNFSKYHETLENDDSNDKHMSHMSIVRNGIIRMPIFGSFQLFSPNTHANNSLFNLVQTRFPIKLAKGETVIKLKLNKLIKGS